MPSASRPLAMSPKGLPGPFDLMAASKGRIGGGVDRPIECVDDDGFRALEALQFSEPLVVFPVI